MKNIVIVLLAVLFLAACATAEMGRKFDTDKTTQINIGKTTEAEVIGLLGAPYRTKIKENGEKAFLYIHAEGRVTPGSVTTRGQKFAILFDEQGVVKAIDRAGI